MFNEFHGLGYLGPMRVLPRDACRHLAAMVRDPSCPAPLDWSKGHAASFRTLYDVAVAPSILDVVSQLLGPNIVLWGASVVQRPSGSIHPWHSDIESSAAGVQGVSVWLGLEHTSAESSLQFISRSHRLGPSLQDVRHQHNGSRDGTTTESVLRWARDIDSRCEFCKPAVSDGQALFFDGRLWHYTENRSPHTRIALLLQYATADSPLRMPDFNYLDMPFRNLTLPQPPCLLVRGDAPYSINRIVQAPAQPASGQDVCVRSNRICELDLPLATDTRTGWRPFPIFGGQTADIRSITCHVSSLTPGSCPHPPHQHLEEEVLLVLDGEVQVVLPGLPVTGDRDMHAVDGQPAGTDRDVVGADSTCRKTLRRGEFVYYPAQFTHTLINSGSRPANYLMFKWVTAPTLTPSPLPFGHYNALQPHGASEASQIFSTTLLFEGPTAYLRKLHCHISNLAPGQGYPPHHDSYDVGIIVLEGAVETAGARVGPNSVIFYPAGEPHGMHNPGAIPARYIVFEFHGSQRSAVHVPVPATPPPVLTSPVAVDVPASSAIPRPSFLTKIRDPRRWKRKLVHWSHRIMG